MRHNVNVIGPNVVKLRYQRGWTQDELAGKLQLLGCNITTQILANIETRRCYVTDAQIVFFAEVFQVTEAELFPPRPKSGSRTLWLAEHCPTKRLRKSRSEKDK
jgi:transcriptional regulator with XRE-family HTH domain